MLERVTRLKGLAVAVLSCGALVAAMIAPGCSDLIDKNFADPGEKLTQEIKFTGGTLQEGPPPGPTFTGDEPEITPQTDSEPMTLKGGSAGNVTINVTNLAPNTNVTVYIQFGANTNNHVSIPVAGSTIGNNTSGKLDLPFSLPPNICDDLKDIKHQIKCYESVNVGGNKISKAQARQIIVDCSKPKPTTTPGGTTGLHCSDQQTSAGFCKTLQYCINIVGSSQSCYFIANGKKFTCSDCNTANTACVTQVVNYCK